MAVIHLTTCFVLLAAGTVLSTSAQLDNKGSNDDAEVGNWTVGDCIMAKFSMEFTVSSNLYNLNQIFLTIYRVPTQSFIFKWKFISESTHKCI